MGSGASTGASGQNHAPSTEPGALAAVLGVVGFALLYGLSAMGAETSYGYGFVFAAVFLALPAMLLGALLYAVLEQVAGRWRSAPAGASASATRPRSAPR